MFGRGGKKKKGKGKTRPVSCIDDEAEFDGDDSGEESVASETSADRNFVVNDEHEGDAVPISRTMTAAAAA